MCDNHPNVFLDTKKKLGDWCINAKFIKINKKNIQNQKILYQKILLIN